MSRGSPVFTLRLSPQIIAAIKMAARQGGTTPSEWVRGVLYDALTKCGVQIPTGTHGSPLPGQITTNDLDA